MLGHKYLSFFGLMYILITHEWKSFADPQVPWNSAEKFQSTHHAIKNFKGVSASNNFVLCSCNISVLAILLPSTIALIHASKPYPTINYYENVHW